MQLKNPNYETHLAVTSYLLAVKCIDMFYFFCTKNIFLNNWEETLSLFYQKNLMSKKKSFSHLIINYNKYKADFSFESTNRFSGSLYVWTI